MVIYRYKGHISLNYSRFGHASRRNLVLFSGGAFRPSEETLNKSKLARPNVATMKNIPFLPKNGDRTHINVFPIGCTPQWFFPSIFNVNREKERALQIFICE